LGYPRLILRPAIILASSLIAACAQPSPQAELRASPPSERGAQQEAESEVSHVAIPDEQVPATDTVDVLVFAEGAAPAIESLLRHRMQHFDVADPEELEYGEVGRSSYPAADIADLGDALRGVTETFLREHDVDPAHPYTGAGRCVPAIARPELVSLACEATSIPDRGYPEPYYGGVVVAVEGGAARVSDVRDMLLAGTELDSRIRRRCAPRSRDDELHPCRRPERAGLSFVTRGLRARMSAEEGAEDIVLVLPWSELDGVILAAAPIGRLLRSQAGVSVRAVPRPARAEPVGAGLAVSAERPLGELLHLWDGLADDERAAASCAVTRSDYRLTYGRLVVFTDQRPLGERIATALGAAVEPISWTSAPLRPWRARSRAPLTLREQPESRWDHLEMPEGTLAVAVEGSVRGRDSAHGARGTWSFVAVAPGIWGWAAGNLLEAHDACVPSADAFLGAFFARERAERGLVRSLVTIEDAAMVLFAAPRTEQRYQRAGRSRVELAPLDAACAIGRPALAVDAPGGLHAAHVVGAGGRRAGAALVLGMRITPVGSYPRRVRWSVYPLGARAPVAEIEADGDAAVEVGERGEVLRVTEQRRARVVRRSGREWITEEPTPAPE
jgi:hypothetical protein